ncbi:hypothetical protein B0H17DRAFT_1211795 [Mycena rosella]|uniref:Uncharacterized protein n=1 Tax=Mycena rosella TaxID=1033263 RepID=A0AAD7G5Z9_MYCRO|nr:hypothetical protein B0H17DRAFT_1211795 [Mycena rosella]
MLDKLARMCESMRALEREEHVHETAVAQGGEREGEEVHLLEAPSPDSEAEAQVADAPPPRPGASSSGEPTDGTADLAQQLRAMAERLALMEARMQTQDLLEERPPDYTTGPLY